MIELFLGVLLGLLLGLVPGFHLNNFLPLLALLPFSSEAAFLFVIGASISYVFSSFLPSTVLGAPSTETSLMVLPGHRLALKGKALTAIHLCVIGALSSSVFMVLAFVFFCALTPALYPAASPLIPFFLMLIMFFLAASRNPFTIIIIALSSILGCLTFGYNYLMPLLTGFFALSTLVISLSENTEMPAQKLVFSPKITRFQMLRASLAASVLGSVLSMVPAVSSNITASAGKVLGKMDEEEFLVFNASTNFTYMAFSFIAMTALGKTRSGSAAFLSAFGQQHLLFVAGAVLASAAFSAAAVLLLSRHFVRAFRKINYRTATALVAVFLIALNFFLTGLTGLLVLFTATAIGIACAAFCVKRTACMSALIVPTILATI
jgi:putative membrane protein